MKRKYYLRGLGLGILITSLVFIIAGPKELNDEEIIKRAEAIGYVKEEGDSLGIKDLLNKETPIPTGPLFTVEIPGGTNTPVPTLTQIPVINETPVPTPTDVPEVTNAPTEVSTPIPTETLAPTMALTPTPEPTVTTEPTVTPEPTNSPTPSPTDKPDSVVKATIVVERGNSATMVCSKMEQAGIVKDGSEFRKYLISRTLTDCINVGTYEMSSDMTYEELAKILTNQ